MYAPSVFGEVENSPEWWGAVATLGALLLGAGALAGARGGDALAVGGVTFFLATGVLAGSERVEAATAVGVAAVVWTAVGIWVARGGDSSPLTTLFGFSVVGAMGLLFGASGIARARRRTHRVSSAAD